MFCAFNYRTKKIIFQISFHRFLLSFCNFCYISYWLLLQLFTRKSRVFQFSNIHSMQVIFYFRNKSTRRYEVQGRKTSHVRPWIQKLSGLCRAYGETRGVQNQYLSRRMWAIITSSSLEASAKYFSKWVIRKRKIWLHEEKRKGIFGVEGPVEKIHQWGIHVWRNEICDFNGEKRCS